MARSRYARKPRAANGVGHSAGFLVADDEVVLAAKNQCWTTDAVERCRRVGAIAQCHHSVDGGRSACFLNHASDLSNNARRRIRLQQAREHSIGQYTGAAFPNPDSEESRISVRASRLILG